MENAPTTVDYIVQVTYTHKRGTTREERDDAWDAYISQTVRPRLDAYPDLKIVGDAPGVRALVVRSTPEAFRALFSATPVYRERQHRRLNYPGIQTVCDWELDGSPRIPTELQDIVRHVELNRRIFLTD